MADIKHVGRLKGTNKKVVVAYRTIPGDSKSAVVIETAKLDPLDHDALIKVVESNEGQTSFELFEVLQRNMTPDSQVMLTKLKAQNAAEILGESGKTLSDNDRRMVSEIVGDICLLK